MKYSVKGNVQIGSSGNIHMTDRVKSFLTKVFGGKEAEETPPKNGISGNFGFSGSSEYELSAEISTEEMIELFKLGKDYDIHTWDIIKSMGRETLAGLVKVREVAAEEIPQWQELVHKFNMSDMDYDLEEDIKAHECATAKADKFKTTKE